MAVFSQLYHPFLLDSDCSPCSPIKMPGFLEEPNNDTTSFSEFYQPETLQGIPASVNVLESNSRVNQSTKVSLSNNKTSVTNKTSTDSQQVTPMDKKRKNKEGSSMSSAQTKNIREVKGKKQKKSNAMMKASKDKNPGEFKKDEKKASEEAPRGYIHVRARRGQATDRHSLAERVRRWKINERMKILQAIVPGCDKVIGKALMLDAIINYVQLLQHQVELLSTKLASVNRMFYGFGMDIDAFMARTDQSLNALASPPPSMQPCNPTLPLVIDGTNNYTFQDISASLLFQQGHMSNTSPQENGQLL